MTTLHVDGSLPACAFTQGGDALVAAGDMDVYLLGLARSHRAAVRPEA